MQIFQSFPWLCETCVKNWIVPIRIQLKTHGIETQNGKIWKNIWDEVNLLLYDDYVDWDVEVELDLVKIMAKVNWWIKLIE